MSRRRVPVGPGGEMADATEIGFRTSGEYWNEYLLDDGTVVRIKLIVTSALKLDGQTDPNGDPIYIVQSTNVMNISSPEHLRGE